LGGKSGRGRCNGLDRHGLARCLALGGLLQNLDLAINTQNFGHLLLELGIATFQIIPNLVRLDFRLAEDLAYRSLRQIGETLMSEGRSILACMARQQPCRQLVRMTVILGLIASQGHQPSLSLRCNRPFTARARPIIQSHRAIGQRSLDAAFNGLRASLRFHACQFHEIDRLARYSDQRTLRLRTQAFRLSPESSGATHYRIKILCRQSNGL